MTSFDYAGIRDNTVEPLLTKFGRAGQIAVNDATSGDPWDSQLGSETLHDVTVLQTRFEKDNNNGTLVEESDVLFLVSTEGVTTDPELADRIIVAGVTFQVVRVDPLRPGPTTMLWKVHARK